MKNENDTKKKQRNGVFIGAYVLPAVKDRLRRVAKARHTTVSEIVREILNKETEKQ